MTALLYLLSFLCGAAAVFLATVIINARRKAQHSEDSTETAFRDLLNY